MIPNRAHFIWLGDNFPWLSYLSVLSCLKNGGFDEVNLYFIGPRRSYRYIDALQQFDSFRVHFTSEKEIFRNCGAYGRRLEALYGKLDSILAIKSDILRYAVLYSNGGVYFDCDFIVLRPMQDLLSDFSFIIGTEKILAPYRVVISRNPFTRLILKARVAVRYLCAKVPKGYLVYKRIRFRREAVNTALIGSVRESRFLREVIKSIFNVEHDDLKKPFYVGPYLLQHVMESIGTTMDIGVLDSSFFYPASPIISEHLFRKYRHIDTRGMIFENTRAIHWYSSTIKGLSQSPSEYGYGSLFDEKKTTMLKELLTEFSIL